MKTGPTDRQLAYERGKKLIRETAKDSVEYERLIKKLVERVADWSPGRNPTSRR